MKFFLKKKTVHAFILAPPRSGTTWLSNAVNGHPDIYCTERRLFGRYADFILDDGSSSPRLRCTMDKFVEASLLPQLLRRSDYSSDRLLRAYIDTLVREERATSGRHVLIDKITPYPGTPSVVIEQLAKFFPQARLIYLIRDGRDVLTSGVFHWMNKVRAGTKLSDFELQRKNAFMNSRPYNDIFFTESEVREWAHLWKDTLETIDTAANRFSTLTIRYEDMLAGQARVLENIFEFIGTGCNEKILQACVNSGSFKKMSGGRSRGDAVASAHVRKGEAGDWNNYFTRKDGELFNSIAGPLLVKLGYEHNPDWYGDLPDTISCTGSD